MEYITLSIAQEDKVWVDQMIKEDGLEPAYLESDGLIGDPGWLEVVVPLATVVIPCITKIVLKIIEKHNSAKVSCGDITVENIEAKDVPKVLEKMGVIAAKIGKAKGNDEK